MFCGRLNGKSQIYFLIFLFAFSQADAGFEFVKLSTTGRADRVSFTKVLLANGHENFANSSNPVITGDNLYAPELLRIGDQWYCYHGGWLTTGQLYDRIYLGISNNLYPGGSWDPASSLMISEGDYEHVNDPTVQIVNGTWYMLYTAARWEGAYFNDWINYSTSTDGVNWTPNAGSTSTEIILNDPCGIISGEFTDIARPSLVYDNGLWRLYFDGDVNNGQSNSYYAECSQSFPSSFDLRHHYPREDAFPGFYEPDVAKRSDGSFIAIYQRGFNELWLAVSSDGINFSGKVKVLDADHPAFNRSYVSNPGLLYDQINDLYLGSSFGMTDNSGFIDHDIGFAYAQYRIHLRSPGNVWHTDAESNNLKEQSVMVSGYTNFDLVRLFDTVTGAFLYEQDFTSAQVGDLWELQFNPAGNLYNDDVIDWLDIAIIFDDWLKNGPGITGDLNNDDVVDFLDYSMLASGWWISVPGPTDLVFTPIADVHVNSDQPSENFHDETNLRVQYGSRTMRSFLRFDVTGIDGETITAVRLRLKEGDAGSNSGAHFEVREVIDGWTETTVTWNNQPAYGATSYGSYTGGTLGEGEVFEIAVDTALLSDGDGIYDIVLTEISGGSNDTNIFSRESAFPPELIVTIAGDV
jgi:hypothetical protein